MDTIQTKPSKTVKIIQQFIKNNQNQLSEIKGAVTVTVPQTAYTFKIKDISHILDTREGFFIFVIRPRWEGRSEELYTFNKKDLQEIYVDFDTETRYLDEPEKKVVISKAIEMMYS